MDKQMTEKQSAFRSTLIEKQFSSLAQGYDARSFAEAVLIAALPEPQTIAEASEQIDALKSGILSYAKNHQDWAQPILDSLQAKYGSEAPELVGEYQATAYGADGSVRKVIETGKVNGAALRKAAEAALA